MHPISRNHWNRNHWSRLLQTTGVREILKDFDLDSILEEVISEPPAATKIETPTVLAIRWD